MSFLLPPTPPAYQITHRLNATTANTASVEVLAPSARQYTATGLKPESVYLFRITAQTRKGWGEAAEALVVTTEKRGDCPLGLGRPEGQLRAPPPPIQVFRPSPRGRLGSAGEGHLALAWDGKWAHVPDCLRELRTPKAWPLLVPCNRPSL